MKYAMIFHANLNYAYLLPERYEHVIRCSYEMIIDTWREHFPDQKYCFEASGYTLQQMADKTPDVVEKLKDAIKRGRCEFMGSPYAHLMMANFPEEDCYWSLEFSQETYEKILGKRAKVAWNPEFGWMHYVPQAFKRAGFRYSALDFESYSVSSIPEIKAIEYNPVRTGSHGLDLPWYDLPGDQRELHFPFKDVVPGLDGFARTDRLSQIGLRYFIGEEKFDDYYSRIKKYSTGEGGLIIYSDDAEYLGTRGWFDVKYNDRPANDKGNNQETGLFKHEPSSRQRLIAVVQACLDLGGEFTTIEDLCTSLPALREKYYVEDQMAWHRTWATAWASTPNSKMLDLICDRIREKIYRAERQAVTEEQKVKIKEAWFYLTCGENTDGRWPPPPGKPHEFNFKFCENHLAKAEEALTWVK
jgi:Alpha-amylase/alpha-mannosidase